MSRTSGAPADALPHAALFERLARQYHMGGTAMLVSPSPWLRVLGPIEIIDERGTIDVGGPTARAVLAVLVLRGSAGVSTDELIAAVWGPGEADRATSYHYISRLRAAMAGRPAELVGRRPGYQLSVADEAVDWRMFRRLAEYGHAAMAAGDIGYAAEQFRSALALWSGQALGGVGSRLAADRRMLTEARLAAAEDLAACELQLVRPQQAIEALGDLADHPVRERAAALMIEALAALGRRDRATVTFHRTRAALAERLGLDPGPELTAAYGRALRGDATSTPTPTGSQIILGMPPTAAHFIGRADELRQIAAGLASSGSGCCVVHGMGGVGKTSLAVRVAREAAAEFHDGCLYLDLRGHTPNAEPMQAGTALERILRRLGVAPAHLPDDLDDRAALYRDQLINRRLLLLLDNVRDTAQIRLLLEAGPSTAFLITSRRRLAALDTADHIELQPLPSNDAIALFRAVAGPDRLAGEQPAAAATDPIADIAARCGYLPLAIRIAAARYRVDRTHTLSALAQSLAGPAALQTLDDGDRSVKTTLATSLADLTAPVRRSLLLLGLHPASGFDLPAACAITSDPDAPRQLDYLVDRHILSQAAPGRYHFHDLVRQLVHQTDNSLDPGDSDRANRRTVDYYLAVSDRADQILAPTRYRPSTELTHSPAVLPHIDSYQQALAWMTANEDAIVLTCRTAFDNGFDRACWRIAFAARQYFFIANRLQPWRETHQLALDAARRTGDHRAEALTLNNLGFALLQHGDYPGAAARYRAALQLFRASGDAHGVHTTMANQAWIDYYAGRYDIFLDTMRTVLAYYERSGADRNAAITRRAVGIAESRLGHTDLAVRHLEQALTEAQDFDLPVDAAMALNAIGDTYQQSERTQEAAAAYRDALSHADRAGSGAERARAHHALGDIAAAIGEQAAARRHWTRALADYEVLGDTKVATLRARLVDLAS